VTLSIQNKEMVHEKTDCNGRIDLGFKLVFC